MRVIVIGAYGLIGKAVADMLAERHEVVRVGRTRGDLTVDYTDPASIRRLYDAAGSFDAVVVTVGGDTYFGTLETIDAGQYEFGARRKLAGQASVVLLGRDRVNDGGSFTLSSGILSHVTNPYSAATGPINAAVDGFALHVAPLLGRGVRINVASPAQVVSGPVKPGSGVVSPEQAARAYVESVEGTMTGQVLRVWNVDLPHAATAAPQTAG